MPLPKSLVANAVWTPESVSSILKDVEPPFPLSGAGFYGYARAPFKGASGWVLYQQKQYFDSVFVGTATDDRTVSPVGLLFITKIMLDFQKTGNAGIYINGRRNGVNNRDQLYFISNGAEDTHKDLLFNPPLCLGLCDQVRLDTDSIGAGEGVMVSLFGYVEETEAQKF